MAIILLALLALVGFGVDWWYWTRTGSRMQKAADAATANPEKLREYLNRLTRMSQVHCLAAATEPFAMEMDNVVITELIVDGPRPEIGEGDGVVGVVEETDDAFDLWQETILRILQLWV